MIWVPDSSYLADSGTKADSSLTQSLELLSIVVFPIDYKSAVVQSSDQFSGWMEINFPREDCELCHCQF